MSFLGQIMTILRSNVAKGRHLRTLVHAGARSLSALPLAASAPHPFTHSVGLHGPQQKGKEQRGRAEVPLCLWRGRAKEVRVTRGRPGCVGKTETQAAARWDSRPEEDALCFVSHLFFPRRSSPAGRKVCLIARSPSLYTHMSGLARISSMGQEVATVLHLSFPARSSQIRKQQATGTVLGFHSWFPALSQPK